MHGFKVSLSWQDAFVEFLNGPQLFNSMFTDDPDADILALLPGMTALLESYPFY